jgi:hypothetical protein
VDDAVRQCGFAVIDVGDNGKISDVLQAQNKIPSKAAESQSADFSRF